jgi:MoxR-like ATPase
VKVPLLPCFGASNEVPNDEELMAVFDRFLIRLRSDNLDSYHFQDLLVRGLAHEVSKIDGAYDAIQPVLSAGDLRALHFSLGERLRRVPEDFLAQYKGLVFQIRAEGVSLSDRRAVKMLKLFAASALVDGRNAPDPSDFFLLKHAWNNLDQAEILDGIVGGVLETWYRDHPESRRSGAVDVGIDALVTEINRIRDLLTSERPLSDIQLFSQLKALNEIKAALSSIDTRPAHEAIQRVDQLLGHVFASGKFA